MEEVNGNKVIKGLTWTFAERIMSQLVSTVVTIILARILDPAHYGIISIVTVFISICDVFVTSGFNSAVVQKKNVTETTFNSAFIISFTISIVLYIVLFVSAPLIAEFYNITELIAVIRVMGLRLPLAAYNSLQQAEIQRSMKFKKFFIRTLVGTIISAFVGIGLALFGFGVWALVGQYLTNSIVNSIMLQVLGNWKPSLKFSLKEAKEIYSFGWKVLLTNLAFTLQNDIKSLVIGKVFSASDLAYYDQGKKFPSLLVTNINSSINKVMLPAYSKKQDNLLELKNMLRKSIKVGMFMLAPILVGFALVSENFVQLILTDKWLFAVPYMQIFCFVYLTRPLESSCHQALLAIGRSGTVLKIIINIQIFSFITLIVAVFIFKSVLWIAVGSLLSTLVSLTGFMLMTWKYIGYSLREQLQDILPTIIVALIMGGVVLSVSHLGETILATFIIQILSGAITYILLSYIFKLQAFEYIKKKLISILKHKKVKSAN